MKYEIIKKSDKVNTHLSLFLDSKYSIKTETLLNKDFVVQLGFLIDYLEQLGYTIIASAVGYSIYTYNNDKYKIGIESPTDTTKYVCYMKDNKDRILTNYDLAVTYFFKQLIKHFNNEVF